MTMNIDEILEAATADFFWVPSHVQTVERPELTYSYSSSPSVDYNRVVRARPALGDPEDLVAEVIEAHGGGWSRWCLNPMSDTAQMRRALVEAGYVPGDEHVASAIRTDAYDRYPSADTVVREVETVQDLHTIYELWASIFGRTPDLSDADVAKKLDACTAPDRRVARFVAYRNGEPAGTGGMTFFDDLSFALIWAGGVAETHRGHGVYTALLATRARVARERGLAWMGLYGRMTTSAPIVASQGYEQYGRMVYFERDLRTDD